MTERVDMTLLDYAERAGIENLRGRIEASEVIRREANTALALVLAGAGTALTVATGDNYQWPALAVSLYLFGLGAMLVVKCLRFGEYPAQWNEPKNLNQPDLPLENVRRWELENIQQRITRASAINATRARWLNQIWLAASVTPLVGVLAWGVR